MPLLRRQVCKVAVEVKYVSGAGAGAGASTRTATAPSFTAGGDSGPLPDYRYRAPDVVVDDRPTARPAPRASAAAVVPKLRESRQHGRLLRGRGLPEVKVAQRHP